MTVCVTLGLLIDPLDMISWKNKLSLSEMFDHDTVEALLMRWLKRNRRKIGIALSGMLLLLALMAWLPVAVVDADERASELVGTVTVAVQATPTEDATVTALNKEKLSQEVQQRKTRMSLIL